PSSDCGAPHTSRRMSRDSPRARPGASGVLSDVVDVVRREARERGHAGRPAVLDHRPDLLALLVVRPPTGPGPTPASPGRARRDMPPTVERLTLLRRGLVRRGSVGA